MKKIIYSVLTILSVTCLSVSAREITGIEAQRLITGAEKIGISDASAVPDYIKFRTGSEINFNQFEKWAHANLRLSVASGFKLLNSSTDKIGYIHYRYQQTLNGLPVEGTMYIVHVKNNSITSMNGLLFDKMAAANVPASLSETVALDKALVYMNGVLYRWQVPAWEQQLKNTSDNPAATWFPKGELVFAPQEGKYKAENYHLCYKFDVYAEKPLKREYVFVDASTGQIVYTINRIKEADATATVVTAYSGTRTMTTDSVNPTTFRLRETGRGLGIETYNLEQGTNYVNTDFTDADNNWNNVNAQQDEYAGDAHWGAEMTYDFFNINFGRNSIDDAGKKLLSYVHYSVGFVNAFWDGNEMTYGDGGGGYTPLTSLDITAHEISHGLTEFTSGLGGGEAGAMNEGFSDCMGIAIRQYGKQSATIDWLIGDEIGGGGAFRDVANPGNTNNPDTYLGNNWDFGQEVHQNSTILSHPFYLVSEGGSGTNDNGDAYNVTAMGLDKAQAIWYRMNTVYLFSSVTYPQARTYAIQAAIDLYGPCTPEVIATTNAWYAVGVGPEFTIGVTSDFSAPVVAFCSAPATADFLNASTNAGFFTWDFGDGSAVSTAVNPSHTYTDYGTYTVKLISDGAACGIDSITKTAYISVDSLNPCIVILPPNGTGTTQTTCTGQLYDSGGPGADYTDNTNSTITISPLGASTITLTFSLFNMEDTFDFLYIYDGPTTASPLIGVYTGTALPNGGIINSTTGSITLRQTSDVGVTAPGFALTWQCQLSNVAPTPNFTADVTTSCSGTINFTDLSTNGPVSWLWDFGDGNTSPLPNPSYTYANNGTYTVQLTVSNSFGIDSLIKVAYITINKPDAPTASGVTSCSGYSANLTAAGVDSLTWFTTPTGGLPVATGNPFTTPVLSANTTYYVESDVYPSPQFAGPVDNTFGTGSIFTLNNYHQLIFDCFAPVKLVSVKVYAQGAADRTITLMDQGGAILNSLTLNIPDGESIVTLNFDVPVGTGLELGMAGTVNMFRNQSGATFPYTLAGVISITGTNAGDPGFYYYFYDWKLQGAPCISARTPVDVTVIPSPVAAFSFLTALNVVTFTDLSTGAVSWFWDFNDGNTAPDQNPVHTYTATGIYTVMLVAIGSNGCTDTTYQTVNITTLGIEDHQNTVSLSVYPNPVKNLLTINFGTLQNHNCTLKINSVIGQIVLQRNLTSADAKDNFNLNISSLAAGVYSLVVENEQYKFIQKIIKQ